MRVVGEERQLVGLQKGGMGKKAEGKRKNKGAGTLN